jgi:hypothetical protein
LIRGFLNVVQPLPINISTSLTTYSVQRKKIEEIGKAMGEKLSSEEMLGLFGRLVKGKSENISDFE